MGTSGFAGDFRKNGAYCRVDVGIDPYEPDCDMYKEQKTPSGWMAFFHGAGYGNRTRLCGLGSDRSTDELTPRSIVLLL